MKQFFVAVLSVAVLSPLVGCGSSSAVNNTPDDEAMIWAKFDKKSPEQAAHDYFFPKKIVDYFEEMDAVGSSIETNKDWPDQLLDQVSDGKQKKTERPARTVAPQKLTEQEVLGRNTWMLWTGGNERFWDWLANNSFGFTDLLKVIDSRNRSTRFRDAGLINEPGMVAASAPDEFGLWLDVPATQETRQWRQRFLSSTFNQILRREHPSQRGLIPSYMGDGTPASQDYGAYANYRKDAPPPPSIYGLSTGVVGLRLFPNPNFDDAAKKRWNAKRYLTDPEYYSDPKVVRPYRVGMSCAFCHASFHPLKPAKDTTEPGWENISGSIGAQYLRIQKVFGNLLKKKDFIFHVLDSQPPGTIDTSLIASDNINNPNAMNAIFNVPQRVVVSFKNPRERQNPASAGQPSLWGNPKEFEKGQPLVGKMGFKADEDKVPEEYRRIFEAHGLVQELARSNENPRPVPHILFDGADSIGAWGALARVYLNIGTYSEQWERLHKTIVGFEKQKPFKISDCENHSVYWHATKLRVAPLRDYFLRITPPMRLLDVPGGTERIIPNDEKLQAKAVPQKTELSKKERAERAPKIDVAKLKHGRKVFAENCIVCHSSIQPEGAESDAKILLSDLNSAQAKSYQSIRDDIGKVRQKKYDEWASVGEFWEHDPGQWLRNEKYLAWARTAVEEKNFWVNNYLSTDFRIPVNLVRTNSARAMATNALDGHMWEDFSSASYQKMPSVGPIKFFDPYKGRKGGEAVYTPRHKVTSGTPKSGGGPGFYRVPSLVSIWSTAPFLHNNSLGLFNNDPSVDGRMAAFNDAMEKMLWPEKRLEGSSYNGATPERLKRDHGLIWRTPEETYLDLKGRYIPNALFKQTGYLRTKLSQLEGVHPIWLPSAFFGFAGFALLVIRTRCRLLWTGVGLAAFGGLLSLCCSCPCGFDPNPSAGKMGNIILAIGIGYVLLGWERLTTRLWIPPTVIGLLIGVLCLAGIVANFLAVFMIDVPLWLYELLLAADFGVPRWVIALGLLSLGAILFLTHDVKKLIRYAAYLHFVIAIAVGIALSFVDGNIGNIRIGPIPKDTPVNLLANVNPDASPEELAKAVEVTLRTFGEMNSKSVTPEHREMLFRTRIGPALMGISRCPDFVMDQGHYFEWFRTMSDDDKRAVIELLKTF